VTLRDAVSRINPATSTDRGEDHPVELGDRFVRAGQASSASRRSAPTPPDCRHFHGGKETGPHGRYDGDYVPACQWVDRLPTARLSTSRPDAPRPGLAKDEARQLVRLAR